MARLFPEIMYEPPRADGTSVRRLDGPTHIVVNEGPTSRCFVWGMLTGGALVVMGYFVGAVVRGVQR